MQKPSDHTHLTLVIKIRNFCIHDFHFQIRILAMAAGVVFLSFCNSNTVEEMPPKQDQFAYDLDNPDDKYILPDYLEEISGLSYYSKDKIACIQDEKACIYILNLEQEKITKKYDFGGNADYEDITVFGNTAYILRNNGHIYRVKDFMKEDRKVEKFNTPLQEKNNTEGMAFDPLSNALLIACKGSPSIEKENLFEGYKAIYKFDLEDEELEKTPHFLIDLNRLDSYIDQNVFSRFSLKVAKRLQLIESETNFQPSGIAIHPLYEEIYVISSIGKLLIVLNRTGKVMEVVELDPKIFRQPEGICFSPNGDMFICNEGQGGKGYILKFKLYVKK